MTGRDEKIERMYKDKQERIARQVALREAVETVALSTATALKDPEVIAGKVLNVAQMYLHWIRREEL